MTTDPNDHDSPLTAFLKDLVGDVLLIALIAGLPILILWAFI